jgi:hypothetical protein
MTLRGRRYDNQRESENRRVNTCEELGATNARDKVAGDSVFSDDAFASAPFAVWIGLATDLDQRTVFNARFDLSFTSGEIVFETEHASVGVIETLDQVRENESVAEQWSAKE